MMHQKLAFKLEQLIDLRESVGGRPLTAIFTLAKGQSSGENNVRNRRIIGALRSALCAALKEKNCDNDISEVSKTQTS